MPKPKLKLPDQILAYVPTGINIPLLMEARLIKPDRARALCHLIFLKMMAEAMKPSELRNIHFKQKHVNISSRILRRLIGREYITILQLFIDNGLIEVSKGYHIGKYPKLYRFKPSVFNDPIKRYNKEPITDYVVKKNILKVLNSFAEVSAEQIRFEPIHRQLMKIIKNVKYNLEQFDKYLEHVIKTNSWPYSKGNNSAPFPLPLHEYRIFMDEVNQEKEIHCSVDGFGGRFHSLHARLPKLLRSFTFFKEIPNEPLVEIDIKNSQPYLLCISQVVIERLTPEFSACINILNFYSNNPDFKKFKAHCMDGTFYDFMCSKLNKDREETKKILLKMMYGRVRSKSPEVKYVRDEFLKYFPSVIALLDRIRSLTEKDLPFIKKLFVNDKGIFLGKRSYHKNISCLLQRLESEILIKRICPEIIRKGYKNFFSVHDCLIIPITDKDEILKIIHTEFKKLQVSPPTIKIKNL